MLKSKHPFDKYLHITSAMTFKKHVLYFVCTSNENMLHFRILFSFVTGWRNALEHMNA